MSTVLFIAKTMQETRPGRPQGNWSDTRRLDVPVRAFKTVSFTAHCRSFH